MKGKYDCHTRFFMKKVFKSFVVVFLIFALAGCGNSATNNNISQNGADNKKASQASNAAVSTEVEPEFAGDGTWTILVYMCGTDLESQYAAATSDIQEMLDKSTGKNARFVIQTGGCSKWQNEVISSKKTERYEVTQADMTRISQMKKKNMGDPATLEDFVKWGVKEYGSGKLGLIFWDHGGGSVNGVCIDENKKGDTLTLPEIDSALKNCNLSRRFNFIGCDACLMSTIEMASMLSKYASYMIASEETESGNGWDYAKIAKTLKKNSNIATKDLGKIICDSFMASCKKTNEQSTTTLSVTDLNKVSTVVEKLDTVSKSITEKLSDTKALGSISKGFKKAENYGGNTPSEGYTNMVDLGDIAKNISKQVDTSELTNAINDAVVYQVKGSKRKNANGLSVYYPLKLQGKKEFKGFEKVCVSPNYLNYIKAMVYGKTNGSTQGFDDTKDWEDTTESNDMQTESQNKIKIKKDIYFDKDGYYAFNIDPSDLDKVLSVQYNMYMVIDDNTYIYLGSDNEVEINDSTGVVKECFEGTWPALDDGSFLTMYVVDETDEYSIYSSPIKLNGKRTNMRFMYVYGEKDGDGYWEVLGAWDGVDEYGQAARNIREIKKGDVIVPIYTAVDGETGETEEIYGDKYKVKKGFNVWEPELTAGDYVSNFSIIDTYGSTKYLDYMDFHVDKKGNVTTE